MRTDVAQSEKQIVLGRTRAQEAIRLLIDWEKLGPEGFVIRTVGQKLVIAGDTGRGTINGVYTFLEDVVGCRWYTPELGVIPSRKTLSIGPLNIHKIPVLEPVLVKIICVNTPNPRRLT